jgi:HNH endonuclease/AP2 domain
MRYQRQLVVQPQDKSIRYIFLTQGKFAVVSGPDYKFLMQWRWQAHHDKRNDSWSAVRHEKPRLMHRVILDAPNGVQVDHVDGDGLNNRRSNIRLATQQQNAWNRGPQSINTSGFKGVSWDKRRSKWIATIAFDGRTIALGAFTDKLDAAKAYRDAAPKYHGEFARTEPFRPIQPDKGKLKHRTI